MWGRCTYASGKLVFFSAFQDYELKLICSNHHSTSTVFTIGLLGLPVPVGEWKHLFLVNPTSSYHDTVQHHWGLSRLTWTLSNQTKMLLRLRSKWIPLIAVTREIIISRSYI